LTFAPIIVSPRAKVRQGSGLVVYRVVCDDLQDLIATNEKRGCALEKAKEYRENAAECRALAKRAADDYVRQSLMQVAAVWDSRAEQLEESAKRDGKS